MTRLLAVLTALCFVTGLGIGRAEALARHAVLTFADPRITEASGLAAVSGLFVTVNDSGDSGRVFTVDRDGATVGVTSWPEPATDDEALAPMPGHRVLVGDIGDNDADRGRDRPPIRVRTVPVGRGDRTVDPASYQLIYPAGPVDAETLMVQPRTGRILVVTKELFGGTVLQAPRRLSSTTPNRLTPIGQAPPIVTDGAFFPDGRHLVLRDYQRAEVYTYPGLTPVGRFALPTQPQGEGIAVDAQGRVFVTSEGLHAQVLRVPLPSAIREAVGGSDAADDAPSAGSTPPASEPGDGGSSGLLRAGLGALGVAVVVGGVVTLGALRARRRRPAAPPRRTR